MGSCRSYGGKHKFSEIPIFTQNLKFYPELTTFTHFGHPLSPCLWRPPNMFSVSEFSYCFKIPHTSEIIQYLSFFAWLISLSIMSFKVHLCSCKWQDFIHFYGCIYILYIQWKYIRHIFFIHSSIDGYLGCFRGLTIVNNDTINVGGGSYVFAS